MRFGLVCLAALGLAACSRPQGIKPVAVNPQNLQQPAAAPAKGIPLPTGLGSLKTMPEAPEAIRQAAKAIVRLSTADMGSGTGFFLAGSSQFVTNAHVVGPENCTLEGCYADIDFDFEHGAKAKEVEVFLVPKLHVAELDLTVFEAYKPSDKSPIAEKFVPPHGLELATDEVKPETDLIVVGHPYGGLKRWNQSRMYLKNGDWCASGNCAAPGNSGSPVLDAQGRVAGLLHRTKESSDGVYDLAALHANIYFSLSTAFKKYLGAGYESFKKEGLKPFTSIPLSGVIKVETDDDALGLLELSTDTMINRKIWNLKIIARVDDLASEEELGIAAEPKKGPKGKGKRNRAAAEAKPAKSAEPEYETAEISLMEELLNACEEDVDDPALAADPDHDYAACAIARGMIECQDPLPADQADRCPKGATRRKWQDLFESVADYLELKNAPTSLSWRIGAETAFAANSAEARRKGKEVLLHALETKSYPPIETAGYLAGFASSLEDMKHGGVDYWAVLQDYASQPEPKHFADELADAISYLSRKDPFVGREALEGLYRKFLLDPLIPVSLKIDVETEAAERGYLK
ncbi:serine protease [bacterium]|nr:serine protease [bacterium]